jgi:steroid delta-isomerase-like uncharacterized protein
MSDNPIDVARETVECFNKGDWDRAREIHDPRCVEEEYSTGRHLEGYDAMEEAGKGWKTAFPDGKGTVTGAYADGPVAVLEITWEGTNTGPMVTPTGEEIPATGRHGEVHAVQVFEVEDGKVKRTRSYFDLLTVLTQLGIGAPSEAGVAN